MCWAVWLRHHEPRLLFVDDLGREHVPKMAWLYAHPGAGPEEAALVYNLGTADFNLDADHSLPAVAPLWVAWLARLAPRDPLGVGLFEWRLTGLLLLGGLLCAAALLGREGVSAPLAAGGAVALVCSGVFFGEWSHTPFFRALLLVPAVLLALREALAGGRWAAWLLAGLAVLACAAQTLTFYGALLLPLAWCAARALVTRDVRRHLAPATVAGVLAAAGLLPTALATARVLGGSAHNARLAASDVHFLKYARVGSDWLGAADVLSWSSPGPLVLAGLALLLVARRRPDAPPLPALARIGLWVGGAGVVLLAVSLVALHALRYEGGRAVFAWGLPRPPALLAFLVRTPSRSWLLLAHVGLTVAAVSSLDAWARADLALAVRRRQAALAAGVVALAVGASAAAGRLPLPTAALTAVLTAAVPAALCWRPQGPAVAALLAAVCAVLARQGDMEQRAAGIGNGAALAAAEQALATALPELRGRHEQRVMVLARDLENACFVLDASCAGGYPARALPQPAMRFLEAAGVADGRELPYKVMFDVGRLQAGGLGDLLGLRYWLIDAGPGSGGRPLGRGPGGELVLGENPGAFPKAWPLLVRHEARTWAEAVDLVTTLGAQGRLRREGVVPAGLPSLPDEPGGHPEVGVVAVGGGHISLRTRSPRPFVAATNEFDGPGWSLRIDGQGGGTLPVNAAFVGGLVPAGEHEVQFVRDSR